MSTGRIMSKIMSLLALAADENASEDERKLAEERAEALMFKHTIDRMDLKPEENGRIIEQEWTIHVRNEDMEFMTTIYSMMDKVATHCNIKVHPRTRYARMKYVDPYTKQERERVDVNNRIVALIGYPEDIAYAERIWFRVFKGLVTNINPKWDASKELDDNVYEMIKAGFSWQNVHDRAYAARPDHYGLPERGKGGGSKLHAAYRRALAERGEEWHVTRTSKKYRTSFSRSFVSTIGKRLDQIRAAAKETVGDGDKYAVALVDTAERVLREFYLMYPEYDPENVKKRYAEEDRKYAERFASLTPQQQAAERAEREKQRARDKRESERYMRNYNKMRMDNHDPHAWNRGNCAAESVDLNDYSEVDKEQQMGELL